MIRRHTANTTGAGRWLRITAPSPPASSATQPPRCRRWNSPCASVTDGDSVVSPSQCPPAGATFRSNRAGPAISVSNRSGAPSLSKSPRDSPRATVALPHNDGELIDASRGVIEPTATLDKAALKLSITETYTGVDPVRSGGINAWIAIMRGCDNMCTFCVVPYTRGRERSRDANGVIAEVQALVRDGYKQVTLLGQNVNSYRDGDVRFADLMRRVADVPGIERVRFTSPHPKDFPTDLIRAIAEHPKLCKHIHLPLQSGNDRVLDLMRRTYTNAEFRALNLGLGSTLTWQF